MECTHRVPIGSTVVLNDGVLVDIRCSYSHSYMCTSPVFTPLKLQGLLSEMLVRVYELPVRCHLLCCGEPKLLFQWGLGRILYYNNDRIWGNGQHTRSNLHDADFWYRSHMSTHIAHMLRALAVWIVALRSKGPKFPQHSNY